MPLTAAELRAEYSVDESELDKSLGGLPGKMKGATAALAGAGLLIGGAVAGGVMSGMEGEALNDKLAAQLDLTGPAAKRAGQVAGSLYADAYGENLGQVNDAVGAVMSSIGGMRDASEADLESMTAKVLNLAAGFEVDVGRSAQVAGQMITSGLARDGAHALDLLTASLQKVPAAVRGDLVDAIDEYGPFMRALGLEGEAAMGLLVKASEKGMYGIDKTGDALKEFTIRATDMSTASKVGYDALGMSQEDMSRKLLAGGETAADAFKRIVGGLQGIKDPAKQSQAALALFGTPLEDLNATEIPKFLESLSGTSTALTDVEGAAERFGDKLNDNASTALTEMKRSAEQAVVGLANKLLPAVQDVAGWLADNLGPAIKAVAGFLGDHETAVKATAIALGALVLVVQAHNAALAIGAAGGMAKWLMQTNIIATATKTWAAVQWLLNAALAMNPIGLVVIAIAALAAGLIYAYNHSETFRDIVNGAFDAVQRSVGNAIGFMIDGFRMWLTVFLTIADGIVSGAATALSWIPGLGDKLQAANTAFDNMKDGILQTLDEAAQKAYGFGEDSGENVAKGLAAKQVVAFNAGYQVADDVGRGLGAGSGMAYNAGVNAAQGLIDGMGSKQFAVAKQAQTLAITAGRAMQTGLQEKSPSRWTMWMGDMLGEGLVIGIQRSEPGVMRAMGHLTGRLTAMPPPMLGVRSPAFAGSAGAGSSLAGAGERAQGGGIGTLVHIDSYQEAPGSSPQSTAQALMIEARTRGWV